MKIKTTVTPLGIISIHNEVFYYQKDSTEYDTTISLYTSSDGEQFAKRPENIVFTDTTGKEKDIRPLKSIHYTQEKETYYAVCEEEASSFIATSKDGISWNEVGIVPKLTTKAIFSLNAR